MANKQEQFLNISPEMSQRAYLNILEDMQEEKQAMEDQRIATFNIMEDITQAQEELKQRYGELDTLKDLVQNLGSSLKTTAVIKQLIQALKQTMPRDTNLAYVIPSPDPGRPSNLMYVHAAMPLPQKYLNSIKDDIITSFELLPAKMQRKEELMSWIHNKFMFEFIEGGTDGDETLLPGSCFNVPLLVRDEILGIVNVSSPKVGLFTKQHINLANTMAGATASTISRLRQLLESEQSRIQSLVESLSNGVIMFDLDQKVTMSNPVAQQMTGLPSQGFYLSELTKLFTSAAAVAAAADKKLLLAFEEKIKQTLQTGQSTHIEEANVSRFSYEVFITPVHDYEKHIIGGALILHDITHLKEVDKMKTEFVSVASHQLRTPLTAIKLFAEMLAEEQVGKLNTEQKDYMDNVQKSTKRMIKLVNDLLNVSRLETGRLKIEPKPVRIEDFIKSIINEVNPVAHERKCKIIFKKPVKKLLQIPIDPTLMRQVIHNLITNAIRYSPVKQCDIIVTLGIATSNQKPVTSNQSNISGRQVPITDYKLPVTDGDQVLISVADNGIGIPQDVQARIFEKFFRADNAMQAEAEGSGLGMYVAKMIIRASGGNIWFESPAKGQNKGTIFYISLPIKGMVKKEGEKGLVEADKRG